MEIMILLLLGGLAIGLGGLGGGGGDGDDDGGADAAEGPTPTQEGDSGNNLLVGLPELDGAIYGCAGSDTTTGDMGDDYLDSGLGDDFIDGGIGDDTFRAHLEATVWTAVQVRIGSLATGERTR